MRIQGGHRWHSLDPQRPSLEPQWPSLETQWPSLEPQWPSVDHLGAPWGARGGKVGFFHEVSANFIHWEGPRPKKTTFF